MIDGNRKIFERIWKLVSKVKTFLDANENINRNNYLNNNDNNNNKNSPKNNAKAAVDIYKLRNSQLSMVNMFF
jgi:hypothetical protein